MELKWVSLKFRYYSFTVCEIMFIWPCAKCLCVVVCVFDWTFVYVWLNESAWSWCIELIACVILAIYEYLAKSRYFPGAEMNARNNSLSLERKNIVLTKKCITSFFRTPLYSEQHTLSFLSEYVFFIWALDILRASNISAFIFWRDSQYKDVFSFLIQMSLPLKGCFDQKCVIRQMQVIIIQTLRHIHE